MNKNCIQQASPCVTERGLQKDALIGIDPSHAAVIRQNDILGRERGKVRGKGRG